MATPTLSSLSVPLEKVTEGKRTFKEHSSSVLDDPEDDRPRKRVRSHALDHAQSSASPLSEVKRTPLPLHTKNIPTSANVDQDQSPLTLSRRQQKKDFRSSIDEIVPASDDEVDQTFTSSQTQHVSRSPMASGSSILYHSMSGDEAVRTCGDGDPLFDTSEDQRIHLPSHRAREANPLVKMVDPPSFAGLDGAISVKTRLSGRNSVKALDKSRKPGPGRSSSGLIKNSLLTFRKGSLKTVKGSYKKQIDEPGSEGELVDNGHNGESMREGGGNNGNIQTPPTADELLGLAGLDTQNAEILSDFEEDAPLTAQVSEPDRHPLASSLSAHSDPVQVARERRYVVNVHCQELVAILLSISLASLVSTKDKLLPSATTTSQMSTPNTTWKRSTIFDALFVCHNPL